MRGVLNASDRPAVGPLQCRMVWVSDGAGLHACALDMVFTRTFCRGFPPSQKTLVAASADGVEMRENIVRGPRADVE